MPLILPGTTSGEIILQANATAGAGTIVTVPNESGKLRTTLSPGTIVTRAFVSNTTYGSSAATIPADNTIPQNTEGMQILTLPIAVTSATNKVRVEVFGSLSSSTGPDSGNLALFFNGGVNAVHAVPYTTPQVNYMLPVSMVFEHVPGTAATHTYNVRVGVSTYTTYINGNSPGRLSGGVAAWTMLLEEVVP